MNEDLLEIQKIINYLEDGEGEICESCKGTDYGESSNNSYHYQCEGSFCDETREELLDSYYDELKEVKKKRRKERIKKVKVIAIPTAIIGVGLILWKN